MPIPLMQINNSQMESSLVSKQSISVLNASVQFYSVHYNEVKFEVILRSMAVQNGGQ